MSYSYREERPRLFTDEGQRMLLRIRDSAALLMRSAGAATLGKIIDGAGGGDSFLMLACVDRLVEIGELLNVTAGQPLPTANHVYVPTVAS